MEFDTTLVEILGDPSRDYYVPGVSVSMMPGTALQKGQQGILAGGVLHDTLLKFPRLAPVLKLIDPKRGTAVYPDEGCTNGMTVYKQSSATPFHLDGYYGTRACKFISLRHLNNGRFINTSTLPVCTYHYYSSDSIRKVPSRNFEWSTSPG